jgi:hypothetical protein
VPEFLKAVVNASGKMSKKNEEVLLKKAKTTYISHVF